MDDIGQIQLIGFPGAGACLTTRSRGIYLDSCDREDDGYIDEKKIYTFLSTNNEADESDINLNSYDQIFGQSKNGKEFGVGVEEGREFSRTKLYDLSSPSNPSVKSWYREFGI